MKLPVIVRHPQPEDSLTGLWPTLDKFAWNAEQVWVAEHEGRLVGGLIVWDAGHDVVRLDNLIVLQEWERHGVGHALWTAVVQDLQAKGRAMILTTTADVRLAYWAQKLGAAVGPAQHMVAWWLR